MRAISFYNSKFEVIAVQDIFADAASRSLCSSNYKKGGMGQQMLCTVGYTSVLHMIAQPLSGTIVLFYTQFLLLQNLFHVMHMSLHLKVFAGCPAEFATRLICVTQHSSALCSHAAYFSCNIGC